MKQLAWLGCCVGITLSSASCSEHLPSLTEVAGHPISAKVQLPATATYASVTTSEQLLEQVETMAKSQPSRSAYDSAAKAIRARMHLDYASADAYAQLCVKKARELQDEIAAMQCGLIRLSLARLQFHLSDVLSRASDLQDDTTKAYAVMGTSRDKLNANPGDTYSWTIDRFAGLLGIPPTTLNRASPNPNRIDLSYTPKAIFAPNSPRLKASVNGHPIDFVLDTGSYFSVIPKSLAVQYGLRMTNYREPMQDLTGSSRANALATVDHFIVGTTEIRNFPVLISDDTSAEKQPALNMNTAVLGLDALIYLKRFDVSHNQLTLFPDEDARCDSPVLLSSQIDPSISRLFLMTSTNHGQLKTMLDTGSDEFASSALLYGASYGFSKMPEDSRMVASMGLYGGIGERVFNLQMTMSAHSASLSFPLHVHEKVATPSPLLFGAPSLSKLSYYFDLDRGVACIRVNAP